MISNLAFISGGSSGFVVLIVVPLILLLGVLMVIVAVRAVQMIARDDGSKDGAGSRDEAELMQELHRGLSRMEQRIEALETLLLDRPHKDTAEESPLHKPEL